MLQANIGRFGKVRKHNRLTSVEVDQILSKVLGRARKQAKSSPNHLNLIQALSDKKIRRGPQVNYKFAELGPNLNSALALARELCQLQEPPSDESWQDIISNPNYYKPILDFICNIFSLDPPVQWWEALRVSFLPTVPSRISFFGQTRLKQIENAFESGEASKTEIYIAAWQLLFDSWLYLFGFHDSPNESAFKHLADLTRPLEEIPLRLAHCIRDLSYGDKLRETDLISLLSSQEPEIQSLFQACFWLLLPGRQSKSEHEGHTKNGQLSLFPSAE